VPVSAVFARGAVHERGWSMVGATRRGGRCIFDHWASDGRRTHLHGTQLVTDSGWFA